MRFNRGAIIASWKLYPIPRLDVVKYRRLWQFLIAHTRAPNNVMNWKCIKAQTVVFQFPLPWVLKAKVRNEIVGIVGKAFIASSFFSLTIPVGLVPLHTAKRGGFPPYHLNVFPIPPSPFMLWGDWEEELGKKGPVSWTGSPFLPPDSPLWLFWWGSLFELTFS